MAKPPPSTLDTVVSLCKRRGLRLPVRRDLRRHPLGLGLRPARRRAEGEHQAAVVAARWSPSATTWSASTPRSSCRPGPGRPAATWRRSPTRWSSASPATSASGRTTSRRSTPASTTSPTPTRSTSTSRCPAPTAATAHTWTEPRQFNMMLKTYLGVDRGRVGAALPAPRDRAGHLPQLRQHRHQRADEAAVRHRPDGQVVPQRDHARQLHLPHPRVRADGDGVLRQARRGRGVAPVLDRRAHPLVHRPRHQPRQPAALRAPAGEAQPLRQADRRHRVPLRLLRARVRGARGHRQPHRLRPHAALEGLRPGPLLLRPGQRRALRPLRRSSRRSAPTAR